MKLKKTTTNARKILVLPTTDDFDRARKRARRPVSMLRAWSTLQIALSLQQQRKELN